MTTATAFGYACRVALADMQATYTWKTWTFGWLFRVLCQVAAFALIGRMLQSPADTAYLLVGSSAVIAVVESSFVISSSMSERYIGTFPLLVAAPTDMFVAFAGRSVQWIVSGTTCSAIALFSLGPLLDVPMNYPSALLALPLLLLVSVTAYCLGLFLSAIVLRTPTIRNVVSSVAWWLIGLLGGAQVPISYWPGWFRNVGVILPFRHGLSAIRIAVSGGSISRIVVDAGVEALIGVGWLIAAAAAFRWLAAGGKRTGTIDFSG